jgi:hypothetical protein
MDASRLRQADAKRGPTHRRLTFPPRTKAPTTSLSAHTNSNRRPPAAPSRPARLSATFVFTPASPYETAAPVGPVDATAFAERSSNVRLGEAVRRQPSASLTLSWFHCSRTARSRRRSCSRSKDHFLLTSRTRRATSFRIATYWSAPWLLLLMRTRQPFEARDVRRNTLVVTTKRQPVGGGRRRGPRVAPGSSAIDVPPDQRRLRDGHA